MKNGLTLLIVNRFSCIQMLVQEFKSEELIRKKAMK